MIGLLGDDTLDGAGGRDTLDGGGGNDKLFGAIQQRFSDRRRRR